MPTDRAASRTLVPLGTVASTPSMRSVTVSPGSPEGSLEMAGAGTVLMPTSFFSLKRTTRDFWSPLPVLRDRDRVRACPKPRATPGLKQALTPTLSRSTGRGRRQETLPAGGSFDRERHRPEHLAVGDVQVAQRADA